MICKLVVPGPIEDVEELRVLAWHGVPGTAFAPGRLIVELETHKAVVEVRAARPGILRAILCEPGNWEKVGNALALFSDEPDEALPGAVDPLPPWVVEFEVT